MNYLELLEQSAKQIGTISCMGIDPRFGVKYIPETDGDKGDAIVEFFVPMLDAVMAEPEARPAAFKPNLGYFIEHGDSGSRALDEIISHIKSLRERYGTPIPIILDSKRGDIGTTSKKYANADFGQRGADAITLHPYMGRDSVGPFIDWRDEQGIGRGCYVLTRTSNPGARDLQDVKTEDGVPFYMVVAGKVIEWGKDENGRVASVVGATYPDELGEIARFYANSGVIVSMLIPGVGAQGATATDCMEQMIRAGYDFRHARINSSRRIDYAGVGTDDYVGGAVEALRKLNREIRGSMR